MADGSYYKFRPRTEGLERKARDALGRWTSMQAVVERTNRKAVEQMSEWAVDHLDERIRREEGPRGRTGKLEAAVRNPKSHEVDKDGFRFLVARRMYEQVAYWRAIDKGSHHMVGRRLRLVFSSGGAWVPADRARSGTGRGSRAKGGLDSAYVRVAQVTESGEREKVGIPFVTVRRPIQPYGYGKAAVERFLANDLAWYRAALDAEAARSGLKLVTGKRR